jgi:hypothetical protein
MVLDFDKAGPHVAQLTTDYMLGTRLARAAHPAFLPGLAPSDFYLFGKAKMTPMGATFNSDDDVPQGVMHARRNPA